MDLEHFPIFAWMVFQLWLQTEAVEFKRPVYYERMFQWSNAIKTNYNSVFLDEKSA